jgi:hypothetical protein
MFDGKRLVLVLMFAAFSIALCAPGALAQTTTTDTQFSDVPITGDCNGTPITVLMTGTIHTVMGFSMNPNGMTHSKMDFTLHATGVDPTTNINYVINDSSHQEVNTRGVAQEQSFGTKMKMISQGPASNLTDRTTLHVVIDSNNNVKVEKSSETISCK